MFARRSLPTFLAGVVPAACRTQIFAAGKQIGLSLIVVVDVSQRHSAWKRRQSA